LNAAPFYRILSILSNSGFQQSEDPIQVIVREIIDHNATLAIAVFEVNFGAEIAG